MSTTLSSPNPPGRLQPIAGDPQLCAEILDVAMEAEKNALAEFNDLGRPVTYRGTEGWHRLLHGLAYILVGRNWTWHAELQPYYKAPAGVFPHGAHLSVIHGHWTGTWIETNRRGGVTRDKIRQNAAQLSLFGLNDLPPVESHPGASLTPIAAAPLHIYLVSDIRADGTLQVHLALVNGWSHSGTRLYPIELVTLIGGSLASSSPVQDLPQPETVGYTVEDLETG